MAQSNTIQQRIALSGADEIKRQLQDLGTAGERATQQIDNAVQHVNPALARFSTFVASARTSLRGLGDSIAPIGPQFRSVSTAANRFRDDVVSASTRLGIGFAAGIGVATAAVASFVAKSAQAADEVGDAAEELGTSVKAYQELSAAAAKVGIDQEKFSRAFSALATNVAQEASKEQDAITKLAQAVVGETQRAGTALLNFNKDPTSKLVGGIGDFLKAARDLAPQVQAALAKTGVQKSVDDIAFSLAGLAQQTGKSGDELRKLFDTLKTPLPALTIFEALGRDLKQVNEVFQRFGIRVTDASGKAKDAETIFGELADAFAKLPDGIQKTADATALFGRSGRSLIPILNLGRDGVNELRQRLADLGLGFTDAQTKIGENFRFALVDLQQAIKGVGGQIGLLFAELATPVLDALRESIVRNSGALRAWAADIAERARPAINDLIKLLRGAPDSEVSSKWLLDVRDAVIALRDGVLGAAPAIAAAFNGIKAVLDTSAKAINAIFGTDLTGAGLAAILIIGQLTGVLPALSSALTLAATAAGLLIVAFTSLSAPALIVAGFVALTAAIIAFRGDIEKAGDAVVEFISNFLGISTKVSHEGESIKAFGGLIGQSFSDAGNKINDLKAKAEALPTVLKGVAAKIKSTPLLDIQSATASPVAARAATSLPVVGKIVDVTDTGVPEAKTQINALKQAWTDLATWFDGWKTGLKQSVADAFTFNLSAPSFDQVKSAFDDFVTFVSGAFQSGVTSSLDAIDFDGFRQNALAGLEGARQAFDSFLAGLAGVSPFDALSGAASDFWGQLSSDAQAVTGTIGVLFIGLQTTITGIFTGLQTTLSNFWLSLQINAQTGLGFVSSSWALLQTGVDQVIDTITSSFTGLWSTITDGFLGAINSVSDAFTGLSSTVSSIASSILSTLQPVFDFVSRIASALFGLGGSASGAVSGLAAGGFAGGGRVHGGRPGVDSVPAMLMPEEFVIRVAAVRKYGADLFHALNSLRIPAEMVRFRGFDVGGLVQSVMAVQPPPLRFAAGGMVPAVAGGSAAGGGILNLTIGNETFEGLITPKETFSKLARYASGKATRSAGRKPSWYGGTKV